MKKAVIKPHPHRFQQRFVEITRLGAMQGSNHSRESEIFTAHSCD